MNRYFSWYKSWRCLPIIDFVEGWELAYQRQFAQAAKRFQRGLRNYPLHQVSPDARYALAICYKRLNDSVAYRLTLQECIRRYPAHQSAHTDLIHLEINSGAYRAAVKTIRSYLRVFGVSAEDLDDLMLCLLKSHAPQSLVDQTLKEYSFSVQELSSIPRMLYELRFGNLTRARAMLALRFQADDETEDERLLFATFCLEQGKILFARQLLRELYEQNPRSVEITFRLSQSFVDDLKFSDIEAGKYFALQAAQFSDYRYAPALDLLATLYRQNDETLLADLFEARLELAKHCSCYEVRSSGRQSDSGTLSA